jgi:lysozyme
VRFVFIKATDGAFNNDNMFVRNWQNATSAGLLTGAYHFFRPLHDPIKQADFFLKTIASRKGLPPVVDLEWSPRRGIKDEWTLVRGGQPVIPVRKRVEIIAQYLQRIESQIGRKPIIYTATSWWNPTLNNAKTCGQLNFADYSLWIAFYPKKRPLVLPAPWKNYLIHQYSGSGNIAGFHPIDRNQFEGTLDVLQALST